MRGGRSVKKVIRNLTTGPPKFGAPTISQMATSVEHKNATGSLDAALEPTISQMATSVEHVLH